MHIDFGRLPAPRGAARGMLLLGGAVAAAAFSHPAAGQGAAAAIPVLGAPRRVLAARKPINVTIGHAAPAFADLNGDGKKDLVVGQFGDGKARVYLNTGTTTSPAFTGYTYLKANGQDATVPYG